LFIALGILLPIAFHMIGQGKVFLPMHLPVLLAGFTCGPGVGAVVGAVTPVLSSALTGMPPMMPMAPMMTLELATYGAVTGLLYRRARLGIYPSLIVAMIAGRLVYGCCGAVLLPVLGLEGISPLYPLTAGVLSSLPGIVIQLAFVPAVVYLVQRSAAGAPGGPVEARGEGS